MKALRTPDDRFNVIPDYPFEPHYVTVGDNLRLHYVDHGPKDATKNKGVVIMIKNVAVAGFRVLAPDLIGFGKSDKPSETSDYTYTRHVGWMTDWLTQMDIKDAVLFCQDWGGLIGLRLVAAFPERFAGVVAVPKPYLNFLWAGYCAEPRLSLWARGWRPPITRLTPMRAIKPARGFSPLLFRYRPIWTGPRIM